MPKKCPPGVICFENVTIVFIILILFIVSYMFYLNIRFNPITPSQETQKIIVRPSIPPQTISSRHDIFNDPYAPPLKSDGLYFRNDSSDIRGVPPIHPPIQVPVNIETRGLSTQYSQMGILTSNTGDNLILPLMGRRHMSGRDKWQYYTISNTGSLNTKLPISVNGKSCTSEYGCDQIMNNESVFVSGYNNEFNATIYENNMFNYIPY